MIGLRWLFPDHQTTPDVESAPGLRTNRWVVANAMAFQATWFGCVVGGGVGESIWWGAAGIALLSAMSIWRRKIGSDVLTVLALSSVGWGLEMLWINTGVLDYGQTQVPVWIIMLWVGVALTVNHSLSFFHSYPFAGALMAAGSAPLCYLGGQRFGAVEVADPWLLGWVAATWFIVFYLLFWLKRVEEPA